MTKLEQMVRAIETELGIAPASIGPVKANRIAQACLSVLAEPDSAMIAAAYNDFRDENLFNEWTWRQMIQAAAEVRGE
jgi:hypothetical protein